MKRAEWFIMHGRGHWAKWVRPFTCDRVDPRKGPCLAQVEKGDVYLSTQIPKFPDVGKDDRRYYLKVRYCFRCGDMELPANHPLHHNPVVRNLTLGR